jgi:hypothetical protein
VCVAAAVCARQCRGKGTDARDCQGEGCGGSRSRKLILFLEKKPVRVFTSRPDPPRFGFSDGKAQRGGTERESEGVG